MRRRVITTIISGLLFALPLHAGAQRVPNVFVAGEAALAEEVNENFTAVAGPDTGRIFIAPKGIDSSLGPTARSVPMGAVSFTAAFGRPSDYRSGGTEDISIRLLLSGCANTNVSIEVVTDYLNEGANVDNTETDAIPEFLMPADTTPTTITVPPAPVTRTALGDVNYVTVTRNAAQTAPVCGVGVLDLHGIIVEYPR